MRKQFKERKRAKKRIQESQEKLLQRARELSNNHERELRIAPPDTEKMSEIIIDYAEPLLNVSESQTEQKKALTMAIMVWNLSLLPEEKALDQKNYLKKFLGLGKADDLSDLDNQVFELMLQRKKTFYEDIHRMVIDFEFVETPNGIHLNVVSNT